MLVLAIESAAAAAAVAIANEHGTVVEEVHLDGRRHAETITPSIKSCCEKAGIELAEIDAIAVDIGPGLFTGLRVGVGTAKALAYALGCKVVAVRSLEILAVAAIAAISGGSTVRATGSDSGGPASVVSVLDARRGEVVSAEFTMSEQGALAAGPDHLETPAELIERLRALTGTKGGGAGGEVVVVGDGAIRYSEALSEIPGLTMGDASLASPPVSALAAIGVALAMAGNFENPLTLAPLYVRQADARINWTSRATRSDPAQSE
jgi:tRNA threonylcarbamoyladenosine biosynthesis protein TsaB